MELISDKIGTQKLREKDITQWDAAISFIEQLPYGRNSNREAILLVLSEERGTCSSKHAFLKQLAIENDLEHVKLYIGVYKMNEQNTPKIGSALSENKLDYIPEAHCYLKINGMPKDVTTANSNFSKIENDLLEELEIEPHQVSEFKVEMHQKFIKKWIQKNNVPFTFEEVWNIRERCIENLAMRT